MDLERATRRRAAQPGDEFGEEVLELLDEADDVDRCQSCLEEVEKLRGWIRAAARGLEFGEHRFAEGEVVGDGVAEDRGTGEREEGSKACAGHRAEAAVTIVTAGDEGVIPAGDHPPFGVQPGDRIPEDEDVERVAQERFPVVDPVRIVEELGAEDRRAGLHAVRIALLPRHEFLDMDSPLVGGRPLEELQQRRAGTLVDMVEDDSWQHDDPPTRSTNPSGSAEPSELAGEHHGAPCGGEPRECGECPQRHDPPRSDDVTVFGRFRQIDRIEAGSAPRPLDRRVLSAEKPALNLALADVVLRRDQAHANQRHHREHQPPEPGRVGEAERGGRHGHALSRSPGTGVDSTGARPT